MDGKRIQDYQSNEAKALLATYRQFEILIPAEEKEGSDHTGEDGRFVEDLIREYLSKYLPKGLEVLTGFILRPAVKTGASGKERRGDEDTHSSQLDIIVFDSEHYPVFQRFGDSVIVPPEGVVAIFSVKKHFNDVDIANECKALYKASKLCRATNSANEKVRGPFLGLVCMKSKIDKKRPPTHEWIFKKIQEVYSASETPTFDDLVGFVGSLEEWSMFKRRPTGTPVTKAKYIYLKHEEDELHFGLQFLLTEVLSVFYDKTRSDMKRPGFTAFPSGRPQNESLGEIQCNKIR